MRRPSVHRAVRRQPVVSCPTAAAAPTASSGLRGEGISASLNAPHQSPFTSRCHVPRPMYRDLGRPSWEKLYPKKTQQVLRKLDRSRSKTTGGREQHNNNKTRRASGGSTLCLLARGTSITLRASACRHAGRAAIGGRRRRRVSCAGVIACRAARAAG